MLSPPPSVMRPVDWTLAATYPGGGTKKSAAPLAEPAVVATVTRPEVAFEGTARLRFAADAVVGVANATFRLTRSLTGVGSKFVPLIVSALIPSQIWGEKLAIVGLPAVTTNTAPLVADPVGVVTLIEPVVAPVGTVVAREVAVDAVTVAGVPLNVTVLDEAVVLKPVP
jgi:hypothetical protein